MRIGLQQALTSRLRLNLTSSHPLGVRQNLLRKHKSLSPRHAFNTASYRGAQPDILLRTQDGEPQAANHYSSFWSMQHNKNSAQKETIDTNVKTKRNTRINVPSADRKETNAWIALLEPALPVELRYPVPEISNTDAPSTEDILKILARARSSENAGLNLFTYMLVQQDRDKAVLYLFETLLKSCPSNPNSDLDSPPSNLLWNPNRTLIEDKQLKQLRYVHDPHVDLDSEYAGDRSVPESSQTKTRIMEEVWFSLGKIIIEAANVSQDRTAKVLTTIYKILARMHSQNLVPPNVYSYHPSAYSSAVQKPPILHLLSARILTTLSDAEWRSQSDDLMSKTASLGVSYKDIGKDPPGGRFRLKVRDLGPEIWLEFVLWCCIEGGYATAGANIIDALNRQREDPWFALHWSSNDYTSTAAKTIDWNRVRLRHGGTVGLIEGYNREKPFVELPPRTISAEVVLALVEGLLNNTTTAEYTTQIVRLRKQIRNVVSFLEPHYLPAHYFDYLSVRVMQADVKMNEWSSDFLDDWSSTVDDLRKLETVEPKQPLTTTFDYNNILAQSEVQPAFSHHVLSAYLEACDVAQSVETFAKIQNNVDGSKLHAIESFLKHANTWQGGFFSSPVTQASPDFTGSHGQLPLYQIAAFMNLVTDNNLVRLGEWLLFTEDVDGPVIPPSTYPNSCLATALVRFTSASGDNELLKHMQKARSEYGQLKPSVNFLRALINANIRLHELSVARTRLEHLKNSEGGGYGPSNLAHLAALILDLESNRILPKRYVRQTLEEARLLLDHIMEGRYDSSRGEYTISSNMLYKRQIGHLLRLFHNLPSKTLREVADAYLDKFPISNDAGLVASSFNVVLNAYVDIRGSTKGKQLWELFCQDPLLKRGKLRPSLSGDDDVVETDEEGVPLEVPTDSEYAHDYQQFSVNTVSADHGPRGLSTKTTAGTNPIVIPDIRTLRIIVRAAIDEKRQLEQENNPKQQKQQGILRWATHLYKALGSSRRAIEQEIQQSLIGDHGEAHADDTTSSSSPSSSTSPDEPRLQERRPVSILRNFRPMAT